MDITLLVKNVKPMFYRLILTTSCLLLLFPLLAQFNENLESEIMELARQQNLDSIPKAEAIDRLEAVTPLHEQSEIDAHLLGDSWQYSHSVDHTGRQYRRSNAVFEYNFDENREAFLLLKKEGPKTWCSWRPISTLIEMKYYEDNERKIVTRHDYFGIHSISNDRLVLSRLVRSKNFTNTSTILFNVYFRK